MLLPALPRSNEMKLSLRTLTSEPMNTPKYEIFKRNVSTDEAFALLGRLASPQDIIYLEAGTGSIDFWKHEGRLWVEIYSNQLWATSEVDAHEAKRIIEMLDCDETFGNYIPVTDREWDAYAPLGDNVPVCQGATQQIVGRERR